MAVATRGRQATGGDGGRPSPPRAPARALGAAFLVKLVLLAAVDALGVLVVLTLFGDDRPVAGGVAIAFLLVVNWIYLRREGLPAKYLTPGLVLLLVFQVFVVAYTVYIATTNYGDGHSLGKGEAIRQILGTSTASVQGGESYRITVLEKDGRLALLATAPDGSALVGDAATPLAPAPAATRNPKGQATGLPGYRTLKLRDLLAIQQQVVGLAVPVPAAAGGGVLKTADGRLGHVFRPSRTYDAARDAIVDARTGLVYTDDGRGSFRAPTGERLVPGWRTSVGLANFRDAVGRNLNGPLLGVVAWTFSYAILSVIITFALGTFLALVLNDPRLRWRRLYRALIVLPYAFPFFLSGLVWAGLLNPEFGFVNQVLLGHADIQWLQDPWLARLSILIVSTWFGFPYFFLVSTGALQAIPVDAQQAAIVDGASSWQLFRHVRLPLLLVATSPLLIASFAFSFNDFNTIFMLTNGGPIAAGDSAGATDILITIVYKQAFVGGSHAYGLASAYAVIIFLIVSVISIALFRRTKTLEQIV